jgi:hypothetical protein
MRHKRNIILVIVFILLGLYVNFFEKGRGEKAIPKDEAQKIINFNAEDVEEIILKIDNSNIHFKQKDRKWQIVSPVQADAIESKVISLLSVFDYPIVRVIDPNSLDLAQYGLNKPKIELGLRIKGENNYMTLQVGDNSPRGLSCYAKQKEKPEVFLVGLLYKLELRKDVNYFLK